MRPILWLAACVAMAQTAGTNFDEAKVPAYTLPDPLVMQSGERVTTASMWTSQRRPELLRLFEENVYGRAPRGAGGMRVEVTSVGVHALDGKAIRKQVSIYFNSGHDGPHIDLLIYFPRNVPKPVPVFLGLNFGGNQAVAQDSGIALSSAWMREGPGVVDHQATEATRGAEASRWQIDKILARGYGFATACYNDIDPDFDDGFENGVQPLFYIRGQEKPKPDEWGAIAAWAWGLSRALDYLETDKDVDAARVAVMGHSRLGKTALWAGARDSRFALVISNDSGEGGAALSRRWFGETVRDLNTSFPHWFCANYKKYSDNVECPARGPARTPRACRPAARVRGECGRRSMGRSERRVSGRARCRPGLPPPRNRRARYPDHARDRRAGDDNHRLSHPGRQARRYRLRLGALPGLRGQAHGAPLNARRAHAARSRVFAARPRRADREAGSASLFPIA